MAAAIYLVTKAESEKPVYKSINDVHAMIVNADDGGSDADTIAEAIAAAVGLGHKLPDGYFDTVEKLGVETGGIITTDLDAIVLLRRGTDREIA
jgi:hypothetical protein